MLKWLFAPCFFLINKAPAKTSLLHVQWKWIKNFFVAVGEQQQKKLLPENSKSFFFSLNFFSFQRVSCGITRRSDLSVRHRYCHREHRRSHWLWHFKGVRWQTWRWVGGHSLVPITYKCKVSIYLDSQEEQKIIEWIFNKENSKMYNILCSCWKYCIKFFWLVKGFAIHLKRKKKKENCSLG